MKFLANHTLISFLSFVKRSINDIARSPHDCMLGTASTPSSLLHEGKWSVTLRVTRLTAHRLQPGDPIAMNTSSAFLQSIRQDDQPRLCLGTALFAHSALDQVGEPLFQMLLAKARPHPDKQRLLLQR